jgi:hypothetical protein
MKLYLKRDELKELVQDLRKAKPEIESGNLGAKCAENRGVYVEK